MTVKISDNQFVSISVIVPVYKGRVWLKRCLESLKLQTLDANKFEVILVFNGPDDGSAEEAKNFALESQMENLKIIVSTATNAARARNEGLSYAKGSHITWVDIDDLVSPGYLEAMAFAAANDVVPVAQLANVDQDGLVDRTNMINSELLSQKSAKVDPRSFIRAPTFMTAKLLPLEWAVKHPMDEDLRSGEDVAFYGKILAHYDFKLSVIPGFLGATYYRQLVDQSVSRGRQDRQFMVIERALVIRSLSRSIDSCRTSNESILRSYIRSQASFIKRFLTDNPDERQWVFDYLSSLQIRHFPWNVFQGKPEDIAICYNFVPFSDTGANVAAKRLREVGKSTDVISADISSVRGQNPENSLLAMPYVCQHTQVDVPVTFANARGIGEFVKAGLAAFEKNIKLGRTYKRIYSRSMWPASHFLAAAIKKNHPELEWTAEFSDPVRLTTSGELRSAPFDERELPNLFSELKMSDTTGTLSENTDVFTWAELLPYLRADKLIFTNGHQLKTMISYSPESIRNLVLSKSFVSHHPTLPRQFYEIASNEISALTEEIEKDSAKIRLGYFGEFYPTRGLAEIVDAMSLLPIEKRSDFAVHIFTSSPIPEKYSEMIDDLIFIHPKCSYFEFLSLLDKFDCLLVNDAVTKQTHDRNPYLPSKYSDYKGSSAPIWALVEEGSTLDSLAVSYKTQLGDVSSAVNILDRLWEMLEKD